MLKEPWRDFAIRAPIIYRHAQQWPAIKKLAFCFCLAAAAFYFFTGIYFAYAK